MSKTPRRPAKVIVGPIRARAIRGPHSDDRSSWYWRAELHEDSATRTVWTGWASLADLHVELGSLLAGGDAQPHERDSWRDIRTVGQLLTAWLTEHRTGADLSPHTVTAYEGATARIKRYLEHARLDTLTTSSVKRYKSDARRAGMATGTLAKDMSVLATAWTWGAERGLCSGAAPVVAVVVKPTRDKYTPSRDEIRMVVNELDGWARLVTVFLAATGARVGEAAKLRWRDVDLDSSTVTLTGKGKTRSVPLFPDVARALGETAGPMDSLVFGVAERTVRHNLGLHLERACARANVRRFTPHGLRRAAVDGYIRAGIEVSTTASLMGHSPVVMLRVYRQVTDDDRRRAVMAVALGRLSEGGNVIALPGVKQT